MSNPGPLVSVEWLAERLRHVAIFDATMPPVGVTPAPDTRARFAEAHIPGAVFFDIDELSSKQTTLPHMLPTEAEFTRAMQAMGIRAGATVVVYEQEGVYSAPRARWMLRTFGATEVYLLDGGLKAWIEADLPIERGVPHRHPGDFIAHLDPAAIKDFAAIQALLAGPVAAGNAQVLDARSAARFAGTAPEPRAHLSSGHMPGATSTPFTGLAEDGRMKSPDELRSYFAAKGVDLDKPTTTSCGSGVTAAVVSLGLELAGAKNVTLYDGSWAEYAAHPEAIIVKD
jgi:thiosulfate/3-mercaptopyruvate sulfurtransferase